MVRKLERGAPAGDGAAQQQRILHLDALVDLRLDHDGLLAGLDRVALEPGGPLHEMPTRACTFKSRTVRKPLERMPASPVGRTRSTRSISTVSAARMPTAPWTGPASPHATRKSPAVTAPRRRRARPARSATGRRRSPARRRRTWRHRRDPRSGAAPPRSRPAMPGAVSLVAQSVEDVDPRTPARRPGGDDADEHRHEEKPSWPAGTAKPKPRSFSAWTISHAKREPEGDAEDAADHAR